MYFNLMRYLINLSLSTIQCKYGTQYYVRVLCHFTNQIEQPTIKISIIFDKMFCEKNDVIVIHR